VANSDNLRPYSPGQSGNPAGRPPGSRNRSTTARKWLDTPAKYTNPETGQKEEGTVEDRVVLGLIQKAMKGDAAAYRELMDSVYGRNPTVLTGANGTPLLPARSLFDFSGLSDAQKDELERLLTLATVTAPDHVDPQHPGQPDTI
jgi:hypothetical protein